MKDIAIVILIISTGFMSGCLATEEIEDQDEFGNDSNTEVRNDYEEENYVPIQEYTGEGFTLRDANPKTGEIAEEHRDKVIEAVEGFFLDNYKTEVEVHNIVSAVDGVSVFVESIGEPHFYSFAIVPVDIKNEEVLVDQVWSQEGQVESAIQGGVYAMAYASELNKLDSILEGITEDKTVVGISESIIEKVMGSGFTTSHYFISPNGDSFDNLYEAFIQNSGLTKEEIIQFISKNSFEPEELIITINLYMGSEGAEPSKDVLNAVTTKIENLDGAPRGAYSILLHDNYIDKRRADGMKENSLTRTTPDKIIKE